MNKSQVSFKDNYITTAQAAELLKVSTRYIRYMVTAGQLDSIKLTNRMMLISKESVNKIILKKR